jgi:hypothetical protein
VIQEDVVKMVTINYNSCIIIQEGTIQIEELAGKVYENLERELGNENAMMFVEAYELYMDPKNNTEKC